MASPQEVVVYSCITGGRDRIKAVAHRDDFRYVLFTDAEVKDTCGWEVVRVKPDDPLRTARYHKHNPHLLFPEARYTVWIDGTHWPYASLVPLLDILGENDIAASNHYCRSRVWDEAATCIAGRMDDVAKIEAQVAAYRAEGFPDDLGLYETSYLVRRHTDRLRDLQSLWWGQMLRYSLRDQISLTYCLWKLGLGISTIPGKCRYGRNEFFKMRPHRKNPDFILI